jgi:hypothetical protein
MLTKGQFSTKQVFVGEPDQADLEKICSVLNSEKYPERRDELRRLVHRWQASGPKLQALLDSDDTLSREVQESWKGKYMPGKLGRAHFALLPSRLIHTAHQYAVGMFAALTLNPDCEKLTGPCSYVPCRKYFIQKTKRRTSYCSRRCCQFASAIRHRKKQLLEEREDKLNRAVAAVKRWRMLRTNDDWKTSVCKQEPDITVRFLTRAVGKGDLVPPTKTVARPKAA